MSQSTVSRMLITWANYLYFVFGTLAVWPSRQQIRKTMPECFAVYPKTRVIIDCTELNTQMPASLVINSQMYF